MSFDTRFMLRGKDMSEAIRQLRCWFTSWILDKASNSDDYCAGIGQCEKEIAFSASSGSDGYFAHRAIGPPCILEEQAFPLRLSRTHRLRTLVAEAAHPLLHLKQSAFFCVLYLSISSCLVRVRSKDNKNI